MPTTGDELLLSILMWREARGDGPDAMQATGCTVRNRVTDKLYGIDTYYGQITKKWQYSSITADHDPQLGLWPAEHDTLWLDALSLAEGIIAGTLADNTNGAQFYYATTIPLPNWAKDMTMTAQIGRQRFYK